MDDNQNLKPELKAIYERIMKTSGQPPPQKPPTSTPSTQPPSEAPSQPPPQATTPPLPSTTPFQKQMEETTPPLPQASQTPQTPFGQDTEVPITFSSVSPRPLRDTDSGAFIFSASKNQPEVPIAPRTQPQVPPIESQPSEIKVEQKPGHAVVTFIFVFLFLVVYTIFWLIFFGVINTASLGLPAFQLPFQLPF